MTTATKTTRPVTKAWRKLLTSLPGYDPFASAEGCWFEADRAEHYISFIEECCSHIEGALAGNKFLLEDWQKAIVGNLFGWQKEDFLGRKVRRYRKCFVYVPRKNGKTPLGAAIHNAVWFMDDEEGQVNNIAAASRDQATKMFRHISGMIEAEPEMKKRCRIYKTSRSLTDNKTSVSKVIPADAKVAHGDNQHFGCVDELHAQPNRELVDALTTAMASANRKQPLLLYLTTADFDRPSICNEEYKYACSVRDNGGDPARPGYDAAYLPVIYEAMHLSDDGKMVQDDWTKESTWYHANPNLGVSVSLDYIRDECKKAKEIPSYENTFKRLYLNIKTEQDIRWIALSVWDACDTEIDMDALVGKRCFAGFDLAEKHDIAGYVLLFPPDDECDLYRLVPRFYVPGDNAEQREVRDKVPYLTWQKQGLITCTPGDVIDYAAIKADFQRDVQRFDIVDAPYDPYGFEALRQEFIRDGLPHDLFTAFGQQHSSMSSPTKEFETLLKAKKIAHGGHPVLRWMAGNVAIAYDSEDRIRPSKKKSTEKIDGIIMAVMALGRALVTEDKQVSRYETHGLRTLGDG